MPGLLVHLVQKLNIGTVHQTFYTKTGEEVKSNG